MSAEQSPRKRGRPARLDRDRIVAAARSLDPETLTMQAVADTLGVDRKALNYHVNDRDGLLRLIAADAFEANSVDAPVDSTHGWAISARLFASATRDNLIAMGTLAQYFRVDGNTDLLSLRPAEALLERLLESGFDEETAARALALLSELAFASARDAINSREGDEHPQSKELRLALETAPPSLGAMAKLVASDLDALGEEQFQFGLDIILDGLALRLPKSD